MTDIFNCNGIALRLNEFPIAFKVLDVAKLKTIAQAAVGTWGGGLQLEGCLGFKTEWLGLRLDP